MCSSHPCLLHWIFSSTDACCVLTHKSTQVRRHFPFQVYLIISFFSLHRFLLQFVVGSGLDQGVATLHVVETNPFKHLTHLSLKFLPGSDAEVKKYLATCLKNLQVSHVKLWSCHYGCFMSSTHPVIQHLLAIIWQESSFLVQTVQHFELEKSNYKVSLRMFFPIALQFFLIIIIIIIIKWYWVVYLLYHHQASWPQIDSTFCKTSVVPNKADFCLIIIIIFQIHTFCLVCFVGWEADARKMPCKYRGWSPTKA